MVDCRGDVYKGRWGARDDIRPSPNVTMLHLPVNRLGKRRHAGEFLPAFGPIVQPLAAGEQVLIYCVNGRHRSPLAVATILGPAFDTPYAVLDRVFKMRSLVEFSAPLADHMPPAQCLMYYREVMAQLWSQHGIQLAQQVHLTRNELQNILEDGSDDLVALFTVLHFLTFSESSLVLAL